VGFYKDPKQVSSTFVHWQLIPTFYLLLSPRRYHSLRTLSVLSLYLHITHPTSQAKMTTLEEHVVKASERYSSTYKSAGFRSPPTKHFTFVTCMDARIDTHAAFGLDIGDAHVIRNVRCQIQI